MQELPLPPQFVERESNTPAFVCSHTPNGNIHFRRVDGFKRALDRIRTERKLIHALQVFVIRHHATLLELDWETWAFTGEICIYPASKADPKSELIAQRFPGEWKQGVEPRYGEKNFLDWIAQREGGVVLRIVGAQRLINLF